MPSQPASCPHPEPSNSNSPLLPTHPTLLREAGTPSGELKSVCYNDEQRIKTITLAIIQPLQEAMGKPTAPMMYQEYTDIVKAHFLLSESKLIKDVRKWVALGGKADVVAAKQKALNDLTSLLEKAAVGREVGAGSSAGKK